MSTITEKSVKREAELKTRKVEAKASTRTNERVPDQATVRKDFAAFIKKEGETIAAKGVLRRDALRLTIADGVTAGEWAAHWQTWSNKDDKTDGATERRTKAKDYFREWFGISKFSDPKSKDAKAAATQTQRALEIAQLCVGVYDRELGDAFVFEDDGTTYLQRGTKFAESMWTYMEYDKSDTMKGDAYKRHHPTITVFARTDQVYPGEVSWNDIHNRVVELMGQKRVAKKKDAVVDSTKALAALRILANTAKGNKQYEAVGAKLEAIASSLAILRGALSGPLFDPGFEHVDKGVNMWRELLGKDKTPTPGPAPAIKSIADMKGADVIDMFKRKATGMVAPDAAKDLPLVDVHKSKPDVAKGVAAKSVPHPKGPAAKAARARKRSK